MSLRGSTRRGPLYLPWFSLHCMHSTRLLTLAAFSPGLRGPLTVLVNGVPMGATEARRTLFFQPDGPGFVHLTVMDARGAADSVTVRLQ